MKTVHLTARTPRHKAEIARQVDLRRGLRSGYAFGGLFVIGGIAGGLSPLLSGATWGAPLLLQMIALPLFFGGYGLLFLLPASARYRRRVDAFVNGALVEARVTGHRRAWVATSSARDHVFELVAETKDGRALSGTIRSRTGRFGIVAPEIGARFQALCVPETATLFAPLEIGVDVATV